jgi:serine/threonine protein kinase
VAETVPGAGQLVTGRYRPAGELGSGGMGVVWQAEGNLIGRQVAVKELRAPASLPVAAREALTAHALAEARNAARVRPGAVTLYDVIPASSPDGSTCLWDVADGGRIATLADPNNGPAVAVAVAPEGRTLAAASDSSDACPWSKSGTRR